MRGGNVKTCVETKQKLNNKGFSMLELMVTIAIMSILIGATVVSLSALMGRQAKECSKKIESALGNVRVQTMARRSVTAKLKMDGDNYVIITSTKVDATSPATEQTYILGSKKANVYYSTVSGGTKQVIDDTGIDIVFDRASGELKNFGPANAATADGGEYMIYVEQGKRKYTIRIYKETGKIEYK